MITVMDDWSNVRSWWEVKLMIKQAQRARFFTISGYAIMFICFLGFIATPFFGLSIRIINNVTDPENGRFFPLQTCYPYESAESPYFELTYITQLIAGSFVGIAFSVPDNFFGALVFHACAQCEILKRKMSQLLPNSNDGIVNTMRNEIKFFEFQLRQCVKIHVRLIKLINAIENSFNLLILVQVLCLLVVICCLGFEVIRLVGNTSERPPIVQIFTLAGTLFNLMIHMLVYCIASEILAEYSLGFSQAIYSFSWYLLPKTCSRHIILIMLRSKLPLRLSIGKFFYLSLNTYLNIMKNSIGYISMLLAVNN